jgi:aspartate-semialdehyde dehydrogenase
LIVEAIVRLRSQLVTAEPNLAWVVADNLRLGALYAVVLEAFKLGT